MLIQTTRFGELDICDDAILEFPQGLLGFEAIHRYCLLPHAPGSPFSWLQAVDEPGLAFVLVNPFEFFLEYEFEISDADTDLLQLQDLADIAVYAIVTIGRPEITANLAGPLIINRAHRIACQGVISNPRYGTRHSLVNHPVTRPAAAPSPEPLAVPA